MNGWKLERLRMTRTPRAIALAGTYLFFGLLGPVTAKYLQDIVSRFQSGIQVILADPTPKEGIANYISQVSQTGLIVVIVITAGAFTVNAAAAVTAYTLGTLAAWYETALLLGSPPARAMLAGLLCGAVYLIFAVSVAAAAASVTRSTLGTVGVALGILLALPLIGMAVPLHAWLPSTLVTALHRPTWQLNPG
jgi:ABC-2 type transport system permease protein